jgi:hypothetical protein
MKIRLQLILSLFVFLLAISGPVSAHHAWSGYDMRDLTTVKGTVTEFDFSNPHIWISFEVKDDKGSIQKWNAGGPSPNRLANSGWDRNTLKSGDQITFVGNRISNGTFSMKLQKIVLPDGRELNSYGGH